MKSTNEKEISNVISQRDMDYKRIQLMYEIIIEDLWISQWHVFRLCSSLLNIEAAREGPVPLRQNPQVVGCGRGVGMKFTQFT